MRYLAITCGVLAAIITLLILVLVILGLVGGGNILVPSFGIVIHVAVLITPLIIVDLIAIFLVIILRRRIRGI